MPRKLPDAWPEVEWECWFRTNVKALNASDALQVAEQGLAARTAFGVMHRQAQMPHAAKRSYARLVRRCLPGAWRDKSAKWVNWSRVEVPSRGGAVTILVGYDLGKTDDTAAILMAARGLCTEQGLHATVGRANATLRCPVDKVGPLALKQALASLHDLLGTAAATNHEAPAAASAQAGARGGPQ